MYGRKGLGLCFSLYGSCHLRLTLALQARDGKRGAANPTQNTISLSVAGSHAKRSQTVGWLAVSCLSMLSSSIIVPFAFCLFDPAILIPHRDPRTFTHMHITQDTSSISVPRRLVEPGMRVSSPSAGGSMRGLLPLLLPALLLLTQPWSVAGVLPTGMIEFKSTKGYIYCAGGVRGGRVYFCLWWVDDEG